MGFSSLAVNSHVRVTTHKLIYIYIYVCVCVCVQMLKINNSCVIKKPFIITAWSQLLLRDQSIITNEPEHPIPTKG